MKNLQNYRPIVPTSYDLVNSQQCFFCNTDLSEADITAQDDRGYMQIIPGESALDIIDVTYLCPACATQHTMRFSR